MDSKVSKNNWTSRYLSALCIIAVLLIVLSGTAQYIIETEKASSSLVNMSGKQRMLSKDIALLALHLSTSHSPSAREQFRLNIITSAEQMENAHNRLILTDSPNIQSMYLNEPWFLDKQVRRFIAEARTYAYFPDSMISTDNQHLIYILNAASGTFITLIDDVTNQFQRESEVRITLLKKVELYAACMGLLILLLEALLIFRPMVKTIEAEKAELTQKNDELERLCFLDGLTGVANRRYFDNYLITEWDRAIRDKSPIALIIIDIDYFKAYNDTYGHLAGDECLKKVAGKLASLLKRPADLVARYGGEEFAVVLPNTNLEGAKHVAEELREGIESLNIPHDESLVSDSVTISLGIAFAIPDKSCDKNKLISSADHAMYQAKNDGRNRAYVIAETACGRNL